MSFRYCVITPDGVEHLATDHESFKTLLAELEAKYPEDELEISADVIREDKMRAADAAQITK